MIPASTFSAAALLAELIDWVRIESPTYDAATVNRMEDFIAPRIAAVGFAVERLPGRDGLGDMLRCRRAGRSDGPGILMIAHADTVSVRSPTNCRSVARATSASVPPSTT
jgi:glutamate carboxypeptidase